MNIDHHLYLRVLSRQNTPLETYINFFNVYKALQLYEILKQLPEILQKLFCSI